MSSSPNTALSPRQRLVSFRGIVPFLRPHRALLASWLGALALSSAATLYLPVAFKKMIDEGFSTGAAIDTAGETWTIAMIEPYR